MTLAPLLSDVTVGSTTAEEPAEALEEEPGRDLDLYTGAAFIGA
jgi:hypothetical protein